METWPVPTQEEKTFGILAHLTALSGFIIPFGHIIGPLVIWLIKKDQSAYVDRHGKEALNFQISLTIYYFVSAILIVVFIGVIMLIGLGIFHIVCVIMAAIKASNGIDFNYPLTIRFIK